MCTSSLSPCPSKQSTRSSTLPSLSSPSPTGSVVSRNRHLYKINSALACSTNSVSSSLDEHLSCAECRLLERSISPGTFLSCRAALRTLSRQASECSCSPDWPVSSSEPSPVSKEISQPDSSQGRGICKRRKSSTIFANDSDLSQPKIEKNTFLSADPHYYGSIFSEPSEVAQSPQKRRISSRQQSLDRLNCDVLESPVSPSSPHKKKYSGTSPQRNLAHSSSVKSSVQLVSARHQCSAHQLIFQNASTSEKQLCSEYEPLPLEHCRKRKLVEEIVAATTCDR